MTKNKKTTAKEPAVAVGGAGTKEKIQYLVTTAAEHDNQNAVRRLSRERDKIDALNLIGQIARDFSFWRRRGEHFSACRAIRNHFRLAVAAIDPKKRS